MHMPNKCISRNHLKIKKNRFFIILSYINTVKLFNCVGTKFRGFTTMDFPVFTIFLGV